MNDRLGPPTPLEGIRVVDFTHAWAGPACTTLLGDMGADVIKIEPLTGDFYRATRKNTMFVNVNRNKRGISVNLKAPEGHKIVLKLLEKAEILVENFVPGVIDRLGFGYDAISKLNPGIIYCSISGYGQTGPYSDRPGFDPVAQAVSGIMIATGEPDRPPVRILPSMIDYGGGIQAAYGIAMALMEKAKSGRGSRIDISLMDVGIVQMSTNITYYTLTGELPQRMGSAHSAWSPYQAFEVKDGYVLIAVAADHMWQAMCKELGLIEMGKDPRYSTPESRRQHREKLAASLSKALKQYKGLELEARLCAVGVPCGFLRDVGQVIRDPHVQARHLLEDIDYPGMGKITTVKTPIFFSGEAPVVRRQAPFIGEHTVEVLLELGYKDKEIQNLIEKGVIRAYKKGSS